MLRTASKLLPRSRERLEVAAAQLRTQLFDAAEKGRAWSRSDDHPPQTDQYGLQPTVLRSVNDGGTASRLSSVLPRLGAGTRTRVPARQRQGSSPKHGQVKRWARSDRRCTLVRQRVGIAFSGRNRRRFGRIATAGRPASASRPSPRCCRESCHPLASPVTLTVAWQPSHVARRAHRHSRVARRSNSLPSPRQNGA